MKLYKKLTVIFAVCILSFGILACAAGFKANYRREQERNQAYLLRCAHLAAKIFRQSDVTELASDGDSIYYQDCKREMDQIQKEMGLKYVYTYVPSEDGRSLTVAMISGMTEDTGWKPGQIVEEEVPSEALHVYEGREERGFRIVRNQYGYVATAYCPVYGPDGRIQAVTGADLERLEVVSAYFREVRWVSAWILAGCGVLFFLLRYLSRRCVIRPVVELSEHMGHFVRDREEGREFARLAVKSRDEIGQMTETFNQMAEELAYYIKQTADMAAAAERKRAEMEAAKRIQEASLPDGDDPYKDDPRFSLYAGMKAARQVGGDFYDHFKISDDRLATVIGDVSGKGITAALFMMRAMTLIRERTLEGSAPSRILEQANQELCVRNPSGMFVTVFIGILNLNTGRYSFASAGHNPPYLCRGNFEAIRLESGVPLGLFEDEEYVSTDLELNSGDSLFLYTDGITEAMNQGKELWGEVRLMETLNLHQDKTCAELLHMIDHAVAEFAGDAEQADDITMLCLKYN